MATTALTLIQRTRRYLRDWKDFDATTTSVGTSDTFLNVPDITIYGPRCTLEIDQEVILSPASVASSGTQLQPIRRGMLGTTAASHANGASILIRPDYYSVEILDFVNEAIMAMYPAIYKPVMDNSTTIATNTYTYSIPMMPGYTSYPIPYIYKTEILQPGDYRYRSTRRFQIQRGASTSSSVSTVFSSSVTPAILFKSLPPVGSTLKLWGYGPFPPLVNLTDTLDVLFPPAAEYLIPIYAAGKLLMSGEAGRVRVDVGAVDAREQANRVGASAQIGLQLLQWFERELTEGAASSAMPPLKRHAPSTI